MFHAITARWRRLSARFAAETFDEVARGNGWTIERGRYGRLVYRDPRFAARQAAAAAEAAVAEAAAQADAADGESGSETAAGLALPGPRSGRYDDLDILLGQYGESDQCAGSVR